MVSRGGSAVVRPPSKNRCHSKGVTCTFGPSPAPPQAKVYAVGSWDGFSRPGLELPSGLRQDAFRHGIVNGVPPGTYQYFFVEDGARVLDAHVPTTTFSSDGEEVTVVDVRDCKLPSFEVREAVVTSASSARIVVRAPANAHARRRVGRGNEPGNLHVLPMAIPCSNPPNSQVARFAFGSKVRAPRACVPSPSR